ncbi:hypothetical protein JYU34_011010 [Plutella xylostella]|uniref:Uncharacterized protein n=1 Tax=Plutella xylostella TaxID=51655 RepID=A0ABQ7QH55_PLUXY|nr:hypothetical protein JYU34_011010 [Plutella xylostella]
MARSAPKLALGVMERVRHGRAASRAPDAPAAAAATAAPPTAATIAGPPANGKRPTPIVIYPTVSPESIVVPIVSCIFGFPLLALTVICCLRRRAKLARERARRRNCELDRGELSVVRLSPVKARLRAVSLVRPPRAAELDTVLEERSDPEQTTLSQVQ